jgi:hypothetical protein
MNKLQEKAAELVALGESYGLEPKTNSQSDWVVYVDYTNAITSLIYFTDTGKVCVETWDYKGRRKEKVALKNLEEVLEYEVKDIKDREARAKERHARKFRALI